MLRWGAFVIVLAAVVAGVVAGWPRSCEDKLSDGGQVVEVCRDPAATDPIVLGLGIVLIAIAWPIFQRVSFFGVSLERRVADAEREVAANRQAVDGLNTQIHQLSLSMLTSSQASATIHNHYGAPDTLPIETARDEVRELTSRDAADDTETPAREPRADDAKARVDLLALWEKLSEYIKPTDEGDADRYSSARDVAQTFRDELETVRRVRNSVAHVKPLPAGAVVGALELAQELLHALEVRGREPLGRPDEAVQYERRVVKALEAALGTENVTTNLRVGEWSADAVAWIDGQPVVVEAKRSLRSAQALGRLISSLERIEAESGGRAVVVTSEMPHSLSRWLAERAEGRVLQWSDDEPGVLLRRIRAVLGSRPQ